MPQATWTEICDSFPSKYLKKDSEKRGSRAFFLIFGFKVPFLKDG